MNDSRISRHLDFTLYSFAVSIASPISEAQTAERHDFVFSQAHPSIASLGYKASASASYDRTVVGALAGATENISSNQFLLEAFIGYCSLSYLTGHGFPFPIIDPQYFFKLTTMKGVVETTIRDVYMGVNGVKAKSEDSGGPWIMQVTFSCSAPAWKCTNPFV